LHGYIIMTGIHLQVLALHGKFIIHLPDAIPMMMLSRRNEDNL
jgi:hypothetical protein